MIAKLLSGLDLFRRNKVKATRRKWDHAVVEQINGLRNIKIAEKDIQQLVGLEKYKQNYDYIIPYDDIVPLPIRPRRPSRERAVLLSVMNYSEYLQTPEWKLIREFKIDWANGRCQFCNTTGPLDVHHRTYARRGFEDERDLNALCRECHFGVHKISELVPDDLEDHSL